MHRVRLRALVVALALVCGALLAGCGSAPDTSDPTGVDGLVIPTPSPDPADFVEGVDHPLLALGSGTVWTYAVDGPTSSGPGGEGLTMTVAVADRTRTVAGIDATVVEERLLGGDGVVIEQRERWLAQDVDGNVWLLGRSGSWDDGAGWEAGSAGAEAGLVMPARPRVGDGFRQSGADGTGGVGAVRVRIVEVDASVEVPAGEFTGVLETEETSVSGGGETTATKWYAAGTGLLGEQVGAGGVRRIELVSVERP